MKLLLSFLLFLSATEQLLGGQRPQAGRTKVLLTWADGSRSSIIALSPDEVTELEQRLRGEGIVVTRRDDFDILYLPGGQIDTRQGNTRRPLALRMKGGDPKVVGLHVVQLVAPPTDDWLKDLEETGGRIVHYVPQNGYVIAADDEQAAAVEALPFVQWVSPYDSGLKARSTTEGSVARWIEVAADTDVGAALDAIGAFESEPKEFSRHPNRIVFEATLDEAAVEELLAAPQILSITDVPAESTSDERQAQSATTNVNAGLTQPTNPGTYKTWLSAACSYCTNLLAENFVVGFADTGIDAGEQAGNTHPDLGIGFGSRVRYGTDFTTSTPSALHKDISGHGTIVAGILAGDGATNVVDSGSFLLGVGIAPSAGVLSTRIFQGNGRGGGPFQWAFDATSRGVYVQNHSHNDYNANMDGTYKSWSPMFDEAVRDSNGFDEADGSPVSLIVSAGNRSLPVTRPVLGVLPGATGKNVIAVGGVENYRDVENLSCNGTSTAGFKFISRFGKFSTNVDPIAPDGFKRQWSTYLKPDITAPMSNIFSAKSANATTGWCYQSYNGQRYLGESGTSFAAPAVAGAALLARRVYANFRGGVPDPAAASPALVKAMLIASARSLEGGTVRDNGTTSEVLGPRPDDRQGFGLLSLVDILDANAAKTYVNQTYNFISSGQAPWRSIYYRRDPTKPARVALTWTDAPASTGANPPLVNNLDLTVNRPYSIQISGFPERLPCDDVYLGNNIAPGDNSMGIPCLATVVGMGFDYRNNAELVSFMPGTVFSPVYVAVTPFQIAGKANPAAPGVANQDFALYAFNLSQRGDLNHNGKVDLIFRHPSADNRPFVWLDVTTNTRTYLDPLVYPLTIEALGDFDQNGSDDLVIRDPTTNAVQIRLLNKTATSGTVSVATATAGYEVAGAGDYNVDGNLDILLRAYSGADAGKIQIWRMLGAARNQVVTLTATMADTNYRLEASADFNGDGHADYLWHHLTTGAVQIWYMTNLTVQSTANLTAMAPAQWRVGAVGDYNDDSINDIVWRNQTNGQTQVFFGDRTGFPTSGSLATESTVAWKIVGPR